MYNRILKADKILSFKPDGQDSNYSLVEIEDFVKYSFVELVNKLERIPQVYLCLRGDSMKDIDTHNKVFNEDLSKLFIVGEKARSNIKMTNDPKYQHILNNRRKTLDDIQKLVNDVNNKLLNNSLSLRVSGKIPQSFIYSIQHLDEKEIGEWKIFFLSFLHNSGRVKPFTHYSPFISLTYGPNKYTISRKFALERSKNKKGILFLYCLNAGWPYYIKTIDFGKQLRKFRVNWYPDINSEIMLIDGMYPHYLLGVYEVERSRNPRFVLNPWLYNLLLQKKNFDYSKGIPIDQTNFNTFAESRNYQNYFFHYLQENVEYASELGKRNHYEIIRPGV